MQRLRLLCIATALAGFALPPAMAQPLAKAPAGSTAQCKDGSFSAESSRSRACRGHGGVATWLGKAAEAVQTQSPAVSATGVAPSTVGPSKTPGTLANPRDDGRQVAPPAVKR